MNEEEQLIGRTIINAEIDGFGITLEFDDGSRFEYSASDGGYSRYEFISANQLTNS